MWVNLTSSSSIPSRSPNVSGCLIEAPLLVNNRLRCELRALNIIYMHRMPLAYQRRFMYMQICRLAIIYKKNSFDRLKAEE
jgi:hypothetical protein